MEEISPGPIRILALLWHAPQDVIVAGGFRRTREIMKRAPAGVEVTVLDDRPTFLDGLNAGNVVVHEYRIPRAVRALEARFFILERLLEWAFAAALMVLICLRLRAGGECFDVVFVPSSEQLPAVLAGVLAKRLFATDLVMCNMNIDIFPGRLKGAIARLHNAADRVIAISEHLAGSLEDLGVRSPVFVNTVGIDLEAVGGPSRLDPASRRYDAVFIGKHDRKKGIFDLVEIWRRVAKELPRATLLVIGTSSPRNRERIRSLLERYGLEDNVTLAGTMPDREKYRAVRDSRLCLFPSYVEEWGIVPHEALACGLPVVTYDLPVYRENIAGCEAVFRVRPGDVGGMAREVIGLLSTGECGRFSDVGPGYVSAYGWDEVALREFEIITGALGPPNRRPGEPPVHPGPGRGKAGDVEG